MNVNYFLIILNIALVARLSKAKSKLFQSTDWHSPHRILSASSGCMSHHCLQEKHLREIAIKIMPAVIFLKTKTSSHVEGKLEESERERERERKREREGEGAVPVA